MGPPGKRRCPGSPERAAPRGPQGGFTLLELLISMALLLVLAVVVGGAFRLGFRSIDAGEGRLDALERCRASVGILTAQLQSALPLSFEEDGTRKSCFKGDDKTLRFATSCSLWGENRGAVVVSYRLEPGAGGRWVLYAAERGMDRETVQEAMLFDDLKEWTISYFGREAAEERGRWKTEWTDESRLPDRVQIAFTRDRQEGRLCIPLYARTVTNPA